MTAPSAFAADSRILFPSLMAQRICAAKLVPFSLAIFISSVRERLAARGWVRLRPDMCAKEGCDVTLGFGDKIPLVPNHMLL